MKLNVSNLSIHQQRYIETIFTLCQRNDHAHSKEIAEMLNVKMPSVTEALRGLNEMGLVNYKVRQSITLTDLGQNIGKELNERHKVLASFFDNILGCPSSQADELACQVEHVINGDLRERLTSFLNYIEDEIEVNGENPILKFKDIYEASKGK